MTINQTLQKDALPALIELYIIDLTPCGVSQVFYFTPNTQNGGSLSFDGQVYDPFPIQGSGWEISNDGAPPQPTLVVSNITQILQSYLTNYQDLVGAKVTRTLTFENYLDGGVDEDGSQVFGQQNFEIAQMSSQTKEQVSFKLQSVLDLPNRMIPKQQVLRKTFPGAGLFRKS